MVCHMIILIRSEPSEVVAIAEAVQTKLDGYKAEKRELGSVSPYLLPHLLSLYYSICVCVGTREIQVSADHFGPRV